MVILRDRYRLSKICKKCDEDKSDPHLALLQLRTTPIDNSTPSPGQLLQNRQLRKTLPPIIRPPPDSEQIRASLQSRQVFNHHDVHAKEQTKLLPTQPVWVKHPQDKKWEKATIKSQAETPQSYIVQTSHGDLRRNRVYIKEAPVQSTPNKVQEQPKPVYKIILPPGVQQVPDMVPRIQNPVQNPVMKVMVQNPIQNQTVKTNIQKPIVQNPTLKTCVQNQKYEKYSTKIPSSNRTEF